MAESILSRLDREHGDARQYIASLIVAGGATRAQVAAAIGAKYNITAPSRRSIIAWTKSDPELRDLIASMEAAKRDLSPDDPADLIRPQVNRAAAAADLFAVCEQFPAFALLMHRERDRDDKESTPTRTPEWGDPTNWGGGPIAPSGSGDLAETNEAFAVLLESEGMTDEEFEAACVRRLGDYEEEHLPTPGAGTLSPV